MKINIFADTICGWCFIGHTNLNNALKKFSDIKLSAGFYGSLSLDQQKKIRTFVEITLSIVGIFAAAFIAASFGWIGLALYLLSAAILFY